MFADCHHRCAIIGVDRVTISGHRWRRWSSMCDQSRCHLHPVWAAECSEKVSELLLRNRFPVLISAQSIFIFIVERSFNFSSFITSCSQFSLRDFQFGVQVRHQSDRKSFRSDHQKTRVVLQSGKSFLQSCSWFSANVSLLLISGCSLCSPIRSPICASVGRKSSILVLNSGAVSLLDRHRMRIHFSPSASLFVHELFAKRSDFVSGLIGLMFKCDFDFASWACESDLSLVHSVSEIVTECASGCDHERYFLFVKCSLRSSNLSSTASLFVYKLHPEIAEPVSEFCNRTFKVDCEFGFRVCKSRLKSTQFVSLIAPKRPFILSMNVNFCSRRRLQFGSRNVRWDNQTWFPILRSDRQSRVRILQNDARRSPDLFPNCTRIKRPNVST